MNERYLAVDWIKVLGTVAVVLIHSLRSFFDAGATPLELWLGSQLCFAVPGFLMTSGFLYASSEPIARQVTLRRLQRILVPYLVASLAAQVYHLATGEGSETGALWSDLLLGASFGPYYYVFHITLLALLSPGLARMPRRGLTAAVAAVFCAHAWFEIAGPLIDWFWMYRNPLRWWPYFLVGWCVRLYAPALGAALHRWRRAALSAVAAAVLVLGSVEAASPPLMLSRLVVWLQIWSVLGLVIALTHGRQARGAALARASDGSYAVYLFHLFPLYAARALWPLGPGMSGLPAIAATFVTALCGAVALSGAARAVLGPRARNWLGA